MASPTKTKERSALQRVEALRAAIGAARDRVAACEAQANRGRRLIDAASAGLQSYYSGVEDGAAPDEQRERALRAELEKAQQRMVPRLLTDRGHTRMEYVDLECEGRLAAARGAVEDAENALGAFIREYRDELQAELVERSREARDRLVESFAQLDGALGEWRRTANRWREEMLPLWGDVSPAEVPNIAPVAGPIGDASLKIQQATGGAIDPRGLYPMPASLAPGAEGQERHVSPLPGWEHVPRVVTSEAGLIGF